MGRCLAGHSLDPQVYLPRVEGVASETRVWEEVHKLEVSVTINHISVSPLSMPFCAATRQCGIMYLGDIGVKINNF